MSLRRIVSKMTDREIRGLVVEGENFAYNLDRKFKEDEVNTGDAQVGSEIQEIKSVARAVAKERVVTGSEGSHSELQHITDTGSFRKRLDRSWGNWLSNRRRI